MKVKIVKICFGNKETYNKYIGQIGNLKSRFKGENGKDYFVIEMDNKHELLCSEKEFERIPF